MRRKLGMGRLRRFKLSSLADAKDGRVVGLPDMEAKHARVLRVRAGDEIEVFDDEARVWLGVYQGREGLVRLVKPRGAVRVSRAWSLTLAVALPKGKRASVLVEKCAELGARAVVPMRCTRSVVRKARDAQGFARLRRIAAEASKQCGRRDLAEIRDELSFEEVLAEAGDAPCAVLLSPSARMPLAEVLARAKATGVGEAMLLVGPEGGFTEGEERAAMNAGIAPANIAENTLRVETAAIAACALIASLSGSPTRP